MTIRYTDKFRKQYARAPERVRVAFDKQSRLLIENIRHPSLQAKKFDTTNEIWQGRATLSWRFYFQIDGDTYNLLSITAHPK